MRVLKFGGSSLADAPRIAQACDVVAAAAAKGRAAVVLSALQGVTDRLIGAARDAEKGGDGHRAVVELVRGRHLDAARALVPAADQSVALTPIAILCNDLEEILHGVELVRECSPRTLDLVMSFGERLACLLAAAVMKARGLPAEVVDAREIIRTDEHFGAAGVQFARTYELVEARLARMEGIPVIPGFIGASDGGATTTLGRGGADYSAALVGAGVRAEAVEIWTDVDGVLSADPRIVPDAFVIPEVTFEEAMELSYFGAKVLHPYSMVPAVERTIPIVVRSILDPSAPGTLIAARDALKRHTTRPITGIASIEGVSSLNIEGGGMMGIPGFAARIFAALAREGINIIMISQASSEHTICLVFRGGEGERALAALERELAPELEARRIDRFELLRDLLVVSVIGENMHGIPGMAGRLFSCLGRAGVNVLVIAQGSSERNISFVIEEGRRDLALRAIHAEFLSAHAPGRGDGA